MSVDRQAERERGGGGRELKRERGGGVRELEGERESPGHARRMEISGWHCHHQQLPRAGFNGRVAAARASRAKSVVATGEPCFSANKPALDGCFYMD